MLRLTNISKCKALENNISATLSYSALFASILLTACKNPDDIIQAARFGDLTKLKGCIESGISVDHVDPAGETALFHVIGSGSSDAFELLINNKANLKLRDRSGDSLLHKAATFSREHFSSRLIELGIEVNSTNKVGSTPLHYAVRSGNKGIVQLLIDKGAKIGLRDVDGKTSIEVAQEMSERKGLSDPMGRPISKEQMIEIALILNNKEKD